MVVMGMGVVLSSRMTCITSPPPKLGVRLLKYHQEWVSIMEIWFILEVIRVRASLIFIIWPRLPHTCIPFSLLPEVI